MLLYSHHDQYSVLWNIIFLTRIVGSRTVWVKPKERVICTNMAGLNTFEASFIHLQNFIHLSDQYRVPVSIGQDKKMGLDG